MMAPRAGMKAASLAVLLLASLLVAGQGIGADATRYVTDQLSLDLRSGEGTQYRIVAMLPSGSPVQVIRESRASGYTLVRTPQGTEGWLLSRYLEDAPGARQRLAEAEEELTRVRQASASALAISQENKALKAQLDHLQQERDALQQHNDALRNGAMRDWFLAGAGVVLVGILIGLIIPRIRWRRKSQWNRF
jgi:SH3 domain protein